MINLKDIRNSLFLKEYNANELKELASVIRDGIINIVSLKGGHLSSNLGSVELFIALHRSFDFDKDKLIIDIGHQAYTHKILTGRYELMLNSLRELDGISGYQSLKESIYDHFEAGHAATSLAAASGFLKAKSINGSNENIIAVLGDGALASGLSLEALNNLSNIKEKMIIILNDNGMSISKPTGAISINLNKFRNSSIYLTTKNSIRRLLNSNSFTYPLYSLLRNIKNALKRLLIGKNIFENFNLKYIGPIDGHNFKSLDNAFKAAKLSDSSIVVHVQTIKGKGYEKAEKDELGKWHGVDKFEAYTNTINKEESISWSKAMADIILEQMKLDDKIVTITPGMIEGSKLSSIFETYPNRTVDVGINEEYAFTYASGLSLSKFKPFISIYSTFLQRSYDQILHDNAKLGNSMLVGVDRAGLVGQDGETHQGIYDVAFLKSIPNTIIAMPSDLNELKKLTILGLEGGMFFLRYPRGKVINEVLTNSDIKIGQWNYIKKNNSKTTLIVTGPQIHKVVKEFKDIDVNIVYARFYHPIDENLLSEIKGNIVIYDIYSTSLGLFSSVATFLSSNNKDIKLYDFSLKNDYYPHGSIDALLTRAQLDIDSFKRKVISIIKESLD